MIDVANEHLLQTMCSQELVALYQSSEQVLALLRQIPFDKAGLTPDQVRLEVIDPLSKLLTIPSADTKLLLYIARIVVTIVRQYPQQLFVDGFLTLSRAPTKQPAQLMLAQILAQMLLESQRLPLESLDAKEMLAFIFQEVYQLRQPYDLMAELEKREHL
jgi:hypothetical protein